MPERPDPEHRPIRTLEQAMLDRYSGGIRLRDSGPVTSGNVEPLQPPRRRHLWIGIAVVSYRRAG